MTVIARERLGNTQAVRVRSRRLALGLSDGHEFLGTIFAPLPREAMAH